MSTLPIRATSLPQAWPLPSLARIGAYISLILESYAEAKQEMRKANKKYPYAGI